MQKLQQAEEKLKDQIRHVGSMREYLSSRPALLAVFNIFTFLLIAAIVTGLFLNVMWFRRRDWRRGLQSAHGPPEALSWNTGTVFKVLLLFILIVVGLGLLLSLVKSRLFPGVSGNFFSLLHTTLSDFLMIGLVIYFIRRAGGQWCSLGFREVRFWKDLGLGIAGYTAVIPLFFLTLFAVAGLAYLFTYQPPPHPLVEIFLEEETRAPGLIVYSIFLACVAGPIFEEIFFRGFCYPAFKKRWGRTGALVLSAGFFALSHQNLFAFLPIFVLGLGLGYLYEKRGTLVPSIVLHVTHNTIFISYFFLAKEVLTG